MINVKNLKVKVGEKDILKGISLSFELGKNYLLLGKNGSGKSSLASTIAGNPKYEVIDGNIELNGRDLISMTPDLRSKEGIFLSFQNVPEIKGINLGEYLRIIYNIHLKNSNSEAKEITPFIFKRYIKQFLEEFKIDENFLQRDLNVGFSGGEKRKIEMLQVKLIGPKYIILDEIDSGLDVDAFKIVAELLSKLDSENNTFIIITHYFKIVDYFKIDKVYLLEDGKLKKEGGIEIAEEIKEKGF
ncbi:MAG: Fe-S cluster assembly ATPase SufC [Candidatus Gracilibacteria bacterium]|nr:Fe-S cluster assembly ATPase SufC [Candidatus Gracilibacteria bacterium]